MLFGALRQAVRWLTPERSPWSMGDPTHSVQAVERDVAPPIRIEIQIILTNLERMFSETAKTRGRGLNIQPSDARTRADAFDLFRVLARILDVLLCIQTDGDLDLSVEIETPFLAITVTMRGCGRLPIDQIRVQTADLLRMHPWHIEASMGLDNHGSVTLKRVPL